MNLEKKRAFLTNTAYWLVIAGAVYLAFEYLLPISVPFILGILIAWLVVRVSDKLHCSYRLFRLGLALVIYGVLGLLVTVATAKGISAISAASIQDFIILQALPRLASACPVPRQQE